MKVNVYTNWIETYIEYNGINDVIEMKNLNGEVIGIITRECAKKIIRLFPERDGVKLVLSENKKKAEKPNLEPGKCESEQDTVSDKQSEN